jgi:pimeloyl-ACP methyl ester carboxylesterase
VLLISGHGAPLLQWDEAFCARLVDRGHRVIRFDNRDVGLSQDFGAAGVPDFAAALRAAASGARVACPYRLEDMADDAVGVLDSLGVEAAHGVGSSMGGMIAQLVAVRHPRRALTLTSLMSTSGAPGLPAPTAAAMEHLLQPEPAERDANVTHHVEGARQLGGSLPFDEAWARRREERFFDRGFRPAGKTRQLVAIVASGSRREALARLRLRTLVIHGSEDPLVRPECGHDVAKAVPGARWLVVEGMGHDLRPCLWDRLADAISGHARAT